MQVTETKSALMKLLAPLRLEGKTISFVPTMGALHRGHISLVERARSESDVVVCSIFVNPTQFNNPEDLKNYPRTTKSDLAMLKAVGVDIVFLPSVDEMYPPGIADKDAPVIDFGTLDKVMEGSHRPGHFQGVAIIVSKLFEIVRPRKAYFGEKDFQQLAIIRELVRQQQFPIEIIGCATIREESGLAMSSRNMRLSATERQEAAIICKALTMIQKECKNHPLPELIKKAAGMIEQNGILKVEYLEIADEMTLIPVKSASYAAHLRCFAAVKVGMVRLIDNMPLN